MPDWRVRGGQPAAVARKRFTVLTFQATVKTGKSPRWRDAIANTRDACATRQPAPQSTRSAVPIVPEQIRD